MFSGIDIENILFQSYEHFLHPLVPRCPDKYISDIIHTTHIIINENY